MAPVRERIGATLNPWSLCVCVCVCMCFVTTYADACVQSVVFYEFTCITLCAHFGFL